MCWLLVQKSESMADDGITCAREPADLVAAELTRVCRPGGMIALHISNRYLELSPLITAIGNKTRLETMMMEDGASPEENESGKTSSRWMVLSADKSVLNTLHKRAVDWGDPFVDGPLPRAWTDDYSNLLSTMKAGGAGLFKASD